VRPKPLKFGVFHSPWHEPGKGDPSLQLRQDLELVEHLDRLGFDEYWVGEHHSGGYELTPAPDTFVALAAERTKHIKLGVSVVSVPYHHPLITADRMTYVDHITRGRAMFGFGPGSLVGDAKMMGLDPNILRTRLAEGVEAIVRLVEDDEPVTMKTEWFELNDARLNLDPFTWPRMELAAVSVRSPSGPRIAGQYGMSLLSLAATETGGFKFLADTWELTEKRAAEFGRQVDRDAWRVVAPIYVAPTMEQALRETEWGYDGFLRFVTAGTFIPNEGPDIEVVLANSTHAERVHGLNETQFTAVGTTDMAIAQIERLQEQSGGFGTLMIQLFEFADRQRTFDSLELFAHEVMPHFKHNAIRQQQSWKKMYDARDSNVTTWRAAQDKAIAEHDAEQTNKGS